MRPPPAAAPECVCACTHVCVRVFHCRATAGDIHHAGCESHTAEGERHRHTHTHSRGSGREKEHCGVVLLVPSLTCRSIINRRPSNHVPPRFQSLWDNGAPSQALISLPLLTANFYQPTQPTFLPFATTGQKSVSLIILAAAVAAPDAFWVNLQ